MKYYFMKLYFENTDTYTKVYASIQCIADLKKSLTKRGIYINHITEVSYEDYLKGSYSEE